MREDLPPIWFIGMIRDQMEFLIGSLAPLTALPTQPSWQSIMCRLKMKLSTSVILMIVVLIFRRWNQAHCPRSAQVHSHTHSISTFNWGAPGKQSHTGVSDFWFLPEWCGSGLEGKWCTYLPGCGHCKSHQTGQQIHRQQLLTFDSRTVEISQQFYLPSYTWREHCGEESVSCRMCLGAQVSP